MNMELEINGTKYEFRFGIGFMKALQEKYKEVQSVGVSIPVGFKYVVASMLDGHIESLFDILNTANRTEKPRITEKALTDFLEDESTDVEEIIEEVKDFLLKANASKFMMKQLMDALEQTESQQMKE